ncbi:MAG: hypothetical protein K6F15_04515 [Treponema sp.]|nr:hypothetical protein [Treponema sp.]
MVCSGCGRNLEKEFVYCPWCGERKSFHNQEYFDIIYDRYSELNREKRQKQFRAIEKRLNELEDELNVLVVSAELHK